MSTGRHLTVWEQSKHKAQNIGRNMDKGITCDKSKLANTFNNFFANIALRLVNNYLQDWGNMVLNIQHKKN